MVDCDEACQSKKKLIELELMEKDLMQKIEEDKRNKKELEEFEQKFAKKKSKDRRNFQMHVKEERSNKGLIIFAAFSGFVVLFAVFAYFTIF